MKVFETEYKNIYRRIFNIKNTIYFEVYIILFPFLLILNLEKRFTIFLMFLFSILLFSMIIFKSMTEINVITFKENNIILKGKTFNRKWEKLILTKETKIFLKSRGSKTGICGSTFQIHFKNSNEIFKINTFQTISENILIEIFNEFKEYKSEKIIIDEMLVINNMKEKIKKCQ
jgi:hypothetical protein